MKDNHEKLNEAFANIDSSYIEKAETPPKRKRQAIVAALLVAVLTAGSLLCIPFFQKNAPSRHKPHHIDLCTTLLIDDTSLTQKSYTAKQIGDAMKDNNKTDSVSTSSYTTLNVPNASYLNLYTIPEGNWITLFEKPTDVMEPSKKDKAAFFNGILSRAKEKLNIPLSMSVDEHQISDNPLVFSHENFTVRAGSISAPYNIYGYTYVSIYPKTQSHPIKLNGNIISVDQTQTDDEIITSLDRIRAELCEMMGVNLPDTKIKREYDSYSEYGVTWLNVYFYNKNDHPANELCDTVPRSDYIKLSFDNFENWNGDTVSNKILTNLDTIEFIMYHQSPTIPVRAKMISLEKAEEMLKKGYVFGFHTCELCMQAQNPVDFSDYQYVSLAYKSTQDGCLMPFYAFYKLLPSTSPNNTECYALTYVPAFEISDVEAYFESQKENHKNNNYNVEYP
jgi:hypothetical protein